MRNPIRMLGNERQRAYRYGMTLLCVGVFFNWLSITENNSEPVRFVGFTCLASGALLVCMAICLWANSTRHANSQVRPDGDENGLGDSDSMREPSHATEKPPDYESVTDNSPPPTYADAILLNPSILSDRQEGASNSTEGSGEAASPSTTITIEENGSVDASAANGSAAGDKPAANPQVANLQREPSALGRVLRLSRRFIRRTVSNIDQRPNPAESPRLPRHLARSISTQDHKPA